MSEESVADEFESDLDDYGASKKFSGKKLVLFIILPVLLLAGAGAGVIFGGLLDGGKMEVQASASGSDNAENTPPSGPLKTVFYDLPNLVVNLNSTSRRPSFLKIAVSLELTRESDIPRLKSFAPRIIDQFQVYLRELRIDDLRGSAGIYRLREELLARVNAAVQPTKVKNILFKEVLVQ